MISKKQAEVIRYSGRWLNICHGSVRSGKTVGYNYLLIERAFNAPRGYFVITGKTSHTIRRNVINPLIEISGGLVRYNAGVGECYIGERRCYVIGANDERAERKIRGLTLAGALCDEVTLYPKSFWEMLLTRLSVEGAQLFGTTNPDSPYHYLKTDYIDNPNIDLKSFHFTLDDNPFLSKSYVSNLKKTYSSLWRQRFIDGLWVQAEGTVYDSFDIARHVTKEKINISKFRHKIIGIDYGTSNPCVFMLICYDNPKDGIYITKEYYYDSSKTGRQKTDDEYVRDLQGFIGGERIERIYPDPSAASFILACQRAGLPISSDTNNDVIDGIRFVSGLFQDGKIKIHESCENLIKSISTYIWDAKAQKRGEDKPLKENDHACDAIRYPLYSALPKFQAKVEYQAVGKRMFK